VYTRALEHDAFLYIRKYTWKRADRDVLFITNRNVFLNRNQLRLGQEETANYFVTWSSQRPARIFDSRAFERTQLI